MSAADALAEMLGGLGELQRLRAMVPEGSRGTLDEDIRRCREMIEEAIRVPPPPAELKLTAAPSSIAHVDLKQPSAWVWGVQIRERAGPAITLEAEFPSRGEALEAGFAHLKETYNVTPLRHAMVWLDETWTIQATYGVSTQLNGLHARSATVTPVPVRKRVVKAP